MTNLMSAFSLASMRIGWIDRLGNHHSLRDVRGARLQYRSEHACLWLWSDGDDFVNVKVVGLRWGECQNSGRRCPRREVGDANDGRGHIYHSAGRVSGRDERATTEWQNVVEQVGLSRLQGGFAKGLSLVLPLRWEALARHLFVLDVNDGAADRCGYDCCDTGNCVGFRG